VNTTLEICGRELFHLILLSLKIQEVLELRDMQLFVFQGVVHRLDMRK
jgi:hypothetical protein